MMSSKRDLLVLSKRVSFDQQKLEREVELLESILMNIETTRNVCLCSEVIDVNRYKIIQKPHHIEKVVKQKELKPFQFLYNKN
jgi:hypothetical protein